MKNELTGIKDKNGVEIKVGDVVWAGIKNYKGEISGWSKEVVGNIPTTGEVALTPYGRKVEWMQMQTDSDCLEIIPLSQIAIEHYYPSK